MPRAHSGPQRPTTSNRNGTALSQVFLKPYLHPYYLRGPVILSFSWAGSFSKSPVPTHANLFIFYIVLAQVLSALENQHQPCILQMPSPFPNSFTSTASTGQWSVLATTHYLIPLSSSPQLLPAPSPPPHTRARTRTHTYTQCVHPFPPSGIQES